MKKFLIILLLAAANSNAQSQKLSFCKTFEVEADPIAYMLKGYSFHVIYNHDRFRYDAGIFGIEKPENLGGNKGFKTFVTGYGLKANYMLNKVNGMYVGVDAGLLRSQITLQEKAEKDISRSISLGTHIGYRLFLFPKKTNALSGLYITPWAGLSYNQKIEKVKFTGYSEKTTDWFATVHIGYRF